MGGASAASRPRMMMGSKPKEEPKPKAVVGGGNKKGIMDDLDDLDF